MKPWGATLRPRPPRIIEGKGLAVYPGFIDALSNLGLTTQTPPAKGTPPPQIEEMLSYRSAAYDLQVDSEAFKGMRETGVTTVLASYPKGVFKGMSAVI